LLAIALKKASVGKGRGGRGGITGIGAALRSSYAEICCKIPELPAENDGNRERAGASLRRCGAGEQAQSGTQRRTSGGCRVPGCVPPAAAAMSRI
jgi:hypothetical protein